MFASVVLSATLVWPPPRHITTSGAPLAVGAIEILPSRNSIRLGRTIERFLSTATPLTLVEGSQLTLRIDLTGPASEDDAAVTSSTCYNYTLRVRAPDAVVTSCSVHGAAYALETLNQLLSHGNGALPNIDVDDAPQYAWRGLMLDTGRRFIPVPLVENMLDTMAAVKLNVLHLHASDFCRFAVESKVFPNLTAALTGDMAGHYSQDDVRGLIAYAADRGIRIVPEFDVPGHARGMLPIEGSVHFCTDKDSRSQLYDDPAGETYAAVHSLVQEMASLFTDEVLHLGCDETKATGPCSTNSTFGFERRLVDAVSSEFGKTPSGWEEIYFDAGAATPSTIVNAWTRHTAAEVTATGRRAVESHSAYWYFTQAAPGGAAGWAKCWHDAGENVPAAQRHLVLGGEMSMWTDTYTAPRQCGAFGPGAAEPGAALFPPARDAAFGKSLGGMIWPRGFVGAAAFWNYNASVDPSADDFVDAIWKTNDALRARGSLTCPSKCDCDQVSACGTPYV